MMRLLGPNQQPVVTKSADITPDSLPTVVHLPSVVKGLLDDLEEATLLGITTFHLFSRQQEETRIEGREILVKEVAVPRFNSALTSEGVIEAVNIVAAGGDGPAGVPAVDEQIPVVPCAANPAGEAHTYTTYDNG